VGLVERKGRKFAADYYAFGFCSLKIFSARRSWRPRIVKSDNFRIDLKGVAAEKAKAWVVKYLCG